VPNLDTTKLSVTGAVCIFTTSTTHLLGDIGMRFGIDEVAGFKGWCPIDSSILAAASARQGSAKSQRSEPLTSL